MQEFDIVSWVNRKEWQNADFEHEELPIGVLGQGLDEMILQFYGVAKDCANPEAGQRPTIPEVYKRLFDIKLGFEDARDNLISILTDYDLQTSE